MTLAIAMQKLRDAWPREDFPDRTIALYAHELSRFPEEHVIAAIDAMLARRAFRPSIGELSLAVAEYALDLPSTPEAWAIAERGSLRGAAGAVQEAADFVGGRWAILHGENPVALRAQFRQAYETLREREIHEYATTGRPRPRQLPPARRELMGPTMASLPETERVRPRPLMSRWLVRMTGREPGPPSEEEKHDAIDYLRDGPSTHDPRDDGLYVEAERVHEEATRCAI